MRSSQMWTRYLVLLLVLPVLLILGGCSGGGGGGGGGGGTEETAAYDWAFNIQLTDMAGGQINGFTANDVDISTDSGSASDPTYQGTTLSFRVSNIQIQPCIITVTLTFPGYIPITRQYRVTLTTQTDESGNNFSCQMCNCSNPPNGTAVGTSDEVDTDPTTGTASDIKMNAPVDAGNGATGNATLPKGTLLATKDGTPVSGKVTMMLTVHDGNQTESEAFFSGGNYEGIVVDATGYPGFTPTGNDFYTGDAKVAVFACLKIWDANQNLVYQVSQYPTLTFTLPNGQTGPDGNPLAVGDQIHFFIYDCSQGIWKFIQTVTITAGAGGALQVEVTFKMSTTSANALRDLLKLPHQGGFFFLSNIKGEDQTPPPVTGGD